MSWPYPPGGSSSNVSSRSRPRSATLLARCRSRGRLSRSICRSSNLSAWSPIMLKAQGGSTGLTRTGSRSSAPTLTRSGSDRSPPSRTRPNARRKNMTTTDATTVSVSTEVQAPLARAFHVFTVEIGTWWDDDKHILDAPLAEMMFEPFAGGHIIDRGTDGSECRWARVLAYEPPDRVCFSWDINTQWQIETDLARTSEVEITFTEITPECTRVVLTHRHLDRHGEGWETMRDAVAGGWSLTPLAERIDRANHVAGRVLPVVSDDAMRARLAGASVYTTILLRSTDKCVRPVV